MVAIAERLPFTGTISSDDSFLVGLEGSVVAEGASGGDAISSCPDVSITESRPDDGARPFWGLLGVVDASRSLCKLKLEPNRDVDPRFGGVCTGVVALSFRRPITVPRRLKPPNPFFFSFSS